MAVLKPMSGLSFTSTSLQANVNILLMNQGSGSRGTVAFLPVGGMRSPVGASVYSLKAV